MNWLTKYWRFALFFGTLVAGTGLLVVWLPLVPAILIAFDVATTLFLASFARLFSKENADGMRKRSAETEPDRHILQLLAAVIIGVIGVAVGYEVASGEPGALIVTSVTLFLAWLFGNLLFALHYAHTYYDADQAGGDRRGLCFPGDDFDPDYWDFAYFSFVIGTAFAVSDIRVESRQIRRVVLLHSVTAFYFNIAVVALTISLISAALA